MNSAAAAITFLVSSPFRRTVADRLFSFFWLGRFGRALLSIGGPLASVTDREKREGRTGSARRAGADSVSSLAGEVAALRDRVDALERR